MGIEVVAMRHWEPNKKGHNRNISLSIQSFTQVINGNGKGNETDSKHINQPRMGIWRKAWCTCSHVFHKILPFI